MNKEQKEKLKELFRKSIVETLKDYLEYSKDHFANEPLEITKDEIMEVICEIYKIDYNSPSIRMKEKKES